MMRFVFPLGMSVLGLPTVAQAATCSFVYSSAPSAYCESGLYDGFDLSGYSHTTALIVSEATTGAVTLGDQSVALVAGGIEGDETGLVMGADSSALIGANGSVSGQTALRLSGGEIKNQGVVAGRDLAYDLSGYTVAKDYGTVSAGTIVSGTGYAHFYGAVAAGALLANAAAGDRLYAYFLTDDLTLPATGPLATAEGNLSLYLSAMLDRSSTLLTGTGRGALSLRGDSLVRSGDAINTRESARLWLTGSALVVEQGHAVLTDGLAELYGSGDAQVSAWEDAISGKRIVLAGDVSVRSAAGAALQSNDLGAGSVSVDGARYGSKAYEGEISGAVAVSSGGGDDDLWLGEGAVVSGASGTAIELRGGADRLRIAAAATLLGDVDFGAGDDLLTISGQSESGFLDTVFYGGEGADTLWLQGYDGGYEALFDKASLVTTFLFEDGFSVMFSGFETLLFGLVSATEASAESVYDFDPLTGEATLVSPVPLPASFWMLAVVLAGGALLRRRARL